MSNQSPTFKATFQISKNNLPVNYKFRPLSKQRKMEEVIRKGSEESLARSSSGFKQETNIEHSRKASSKANDYSIESLPGLENRPPLASPQSNHNTEPKPDLRGGIYSLPPKFETLQKAESVVEVYNLSKGKISRFLN